MSLDELDTADLAAAAVRHEWLIRARERGGKQLPPKDLDWQILLFIAGRGWGKTATCVQWAWWEAWRVPKLVVHAIAPTLSDIRGTTFEGPAGFNSTVPAECLLNGTLEKAYNKSTHELQFSNGSLIRGFGAVEEASRLRGPQCHALVCDEIAQWNRPVGNLEMAMNNGLFGLRLPYPDGTPSRALMGTTPRPIPYLKRFEKRDGVRVVRGTSYENLGNLAASYRTQLLALAGTLAGKQEIEAQYIDEENDLSILKRSWVRLWPVNRETGLHRPLPEFQFIVESYDTAASENNFDVKKQTTDPSASIVLGVFNVASCFSEAERKKMRVKSRYAVLLLDCWTERVGLPDLLERARVQHRKKWGPRDKARRGDMVLIEDKSSGPGVRQFMGKWGVPVWPVKPRGSKAMRVHGVSPLVFQGMLFVPESMRSDRVGQAIAWAEPFLEQVCGFAGEGSVEHDDYVDALTGALAYLRDNGMLSAAPEIDFLDHEEKVDHDRDEARKLSAVNKRVERLAPYG